jgi:hypothetical protein
MSGGVTATSLQSRRARNEEYFCRLLFRHERTCEIYLELNIEAAARMEIASGIAPRGDHATRHGVSSGHKCILLTDCGAQGSLVLQVQHSFCVLSRRSPNRAVSSCTVRVVAGVTCCVILLQKHIATSSVDLNRGIA